MALPEKKHYPLREMAIRWNVPVPDIQYYAEHNMLEVQAWVDAPFFRLFRRVKTETGELVYAQTSIISYKDYAILPPEKLRKIFRNQDASAIRRFQSIVPGETIEIFDSKLFIPISRDDLVISRAERDRFESTYNIDPTECCCGHVSKAAADPTYNPSFSGRPSVMHRVLAHFQERCDAKSVCLSLAQEAEYLSHWAEQNITDCQPPKAKTIKNVLRDKYRNYTQQSGSVEATQAA